MCEYNNWNSWYEKILDDFNFSMKEDVKSANLLNELIMKKGKFNIHNMDVKKKNIYLILKKTLSLMIIL